MAKEVAPAKTYDRNDLEEARLTLVAAEPVAEVHRTDEAGVEIAHGGTGGFEGLVGEIGVALDSKTKDRGEPAADTDAKVRVETLHPGVACGLGGNATVYAYIDVVKRFAFLNCLC